MFLLWGLLKNLLKLLLPSFLIAVSPDLGLAQIHRERFRYDKENSFITKMIEDGYTGRKGKGGFYRIKKDDGQKILEAINLKTGKYF